MPGISIIIPTLNEAAVIQQTLKSLQTIREKGHEIILADGGSTDETVEQSILLVDQVIVTRTGRACQMNAGAGKAGGEVLVFLHADTRLPDNSAELITAGLSDSRRHWGRFDVKLSGPHPSLRLVERLMNLRSRLTHIATGDQALFVRRDLFASLGGFPEIPLMEDIAFSKRLKRTGPPLCLRETVVTSSRRWEEQGILRTIALMWRLRLAYFLGASPMRLAQRYGYRAACTPRTPD